LCSQRVRLKFVIMLKRQVRCFYLMTVYKKLPKGSQRQRKSCELHQSIKGDENMMFKIDHLLTKAFTDEASDLHISVNSPPIYRMHGELTPYGDKVLTANDTERMA